MNSSSSNQPLVLDRVTFDRLVDGALPPEEYRRVLQALEQQPAAWRTCAEAFLEAQAWRAELGSVRASSSSAAAPHKPQPVAETKSWIPADWLRLSIVAAASLLLAFAGTLYWQRAEQVPLNNNGHQLAVQSPTQAPAEATENLTYVSNNQPVGTVQLAVNRGTGEEPMLMEVPVFDAEAADALLSNSRPALPDDLVQALEAEGHQVNRQRQLVPVPLDDGRQMMLPVEGYRIVPVSRPSY